MLDLATKRAKITQFLNDNLLYLAVLGVADEVFRRKSQDRDVNNLASSFLSLEKLDEFKTELEKYRADNKIEQKAIGNIGL